MGLKVKPEKLQEKIRPIFKNPISLKDAVSIAQHGDRLLLIHHPEGTQKTISEPDIENHRVVCVRKLYFEHIVNTKPDSSGSPIFDYDTLDLVALNSQGVTETSLEKVAIHMKAISNYLKNNNSSTGISYYWEAKPILDLSKKNTSCGLI